MKLIYQYMLGFLVVVVTCLSIIALAIYHYSENMAYQQTWAQLEGYSDNLQNMALQVDPKTGNIKNITPGTFSAVQKVLANEKVTFAMFDKQGRELYPSVTTIPSFDHKTWNKLQAGTVIRERNSHQSQQSPLFRKHPMTYIIKPWFDKDNHLVAILWVGAEVSMVETSIKSIKSNLIWAFFVSTIIAIVMSWFLASWQVKRINTLRKATKQVAAGDFKVQIKQNKRDEIDDLASDFNEMAHSLQASDEEIERQEQRRKEFMADAAHEMRTPLTTINGLLEGLAYDAIPKESRSKSIDLMRNETKRLIRLVNENLDYEKIRTNQIPLHQSVFAVDSPLNNIVSQLSKKAQAAHDKLQLEVEDGIKVYADYDRFIQIIFNITQNAIQFTNDGLIKIKATYNSKLRGIKISISDNGMGMSEQQVKNIWERYYKADPSRKSTKYGESGLGLAIVHQLMQQHSGDITVQSKLNQGTTFTLVFYDQAVVEQKKNHSNS